MNCAFEEDTMSAVLAYGTQAQFDAEAFLRPFGVAHAVVWQAGQRLLKGRVHQDSGFRIPLGEYLTVADLSAGLLSYLQEHAPMCLALQSLPGTCRIDILAPPRRPSAATKGSYRFPLAKTAFLPDHAL